jgi:hypothetical protein
VALLDADDSWHPDKLARQIGVMCREADLVLTGTGSRVLAGDEHERHRFAPTDPAEQDPAADPQRPVALTRVTRRALLRSNPFLTSSVVVRREIGPRFTPRRDEAEDYDLWLSIVLRGGRAAVLDEELAYRHRDAFTAGGLSSELRVMERKELKTLRRARRDGLINPAEYGFASAWSLAKYARRWAAVDSVPDAAPDSERCTSSWMRRLRSPTTLIGRLPASDAGNSSS